MDIFNFDPAIFLGFLLTFMRISLVVFMLPVFTTEGLPAVWKASMCLILTMAMWPRVSLPAEAIPTHPFAIVLLMTGELLIGFTLGLVTRFFFIGIQMGGDLLAFQMGFTMITLADPSSGSSTGMVSYFLNMVATLIFLTLDGHLYILKVFADTFTVVPAGGFGMSWSLMTQVLSLSSTMFVFAIRIAAPVLAALFMIEMALALMTRSAPQVQIMQFGFPIKIAAGFFFLSTLFVIVGQEARQYILNLEGLFANVLHAIATAPK